MNCKLRKNWQYYRLNKTLLIISKQIEMKLPKKLLLTISHCPPPPEPFGVLCCPTIRDSLHCWKRIYHVFYWLKTGFGWRIGFTNHLQVVTTNNYYIIANLHNLQLPHTNLLSLFPPVFTIRFLATDL
jgi:hypothetical protein